MESYITFRDKDENGDLQYYVLQRAFPHFVGMVSSSPVEGTWQSPIAGYNLWMIFSGTLRGNLIPNYKNISDEIQEILDRMASWYYSTRIITDQKKYKKFKIMSNVSSRVQ
jgi:hypothetical protein